MICAVVIKSSLENRLSSIVNQRKHYDLRVLRVLCVRSVSSEVSTIPDITKDTSKFKEYFKSLRRLMTEGLLCSRSLLIRDLPVQREVTPLTLPLYRKHISHLNGYVSPHVCLTVYIGVVQFIILERV
jgi:hypothetical protein